MSAIDKLDSATRAHLIKWLGTQWQYEHDALLQAIDRALTDEPGLVETHSWPEIVQRGRP